jgi:hypothetical protein
LVGSLGLALVGTLLWLDHVGWIIETLIWIIETLLWLDHWDLAVVGLCRFWIHRLWLDFAHITSFFSY